MVILSHRHLIGIKGLNEQDITFLLEGRRSRQNQPPAGE